MADLIRHPTGFSLNIVCEDSELELISDNEDDLKEFDQSWANIENKKEADQKSQDWQINVLVKFNINPIDVLTLKETKSKRVVVTNTNGGLEILRGLPILAVNGCDVSNSTLSMLEEMCKTIPAPTLLKFGTELVDEELDCTAPSDPSPQSGDDQVPFLGRTMSIAWDEDDTKDDSTVDDHGLDTVFENKSNEIPLLDLQPVSFNGTQGDQSTWSQNCKQRAEIIMELLNTEKSYINGLEELNKEFLQPFVKPLKKNTYVDISSFQTTIETLIHLHDKIYDKFCCAENICSVFQEEFAFLRMYKPYIKDYEVTYRKLLNAAKKRAFKNIFKKSRSVSIDPLGYFQTRGITIVQRPPRYFLLLQQLKKRTPPEHPMYSDLEKGLKVIEGTCSDINEYQRQLENKLKLFELSFEIDPKSLKEHGIQELVIAARRLIRVGEVAIKMTKPPNRSFLRRAQERMLVFELGGVVMCNDILIIMYGKKNRVSRVFKVAEMEAELIRAPIKPSTQLHKFEQIFEVVLRKRDAEEIKIIHSTRNMERESIMNTGVSTSSLVSLAQDSLDCSDEPDFSIYLSTLKEAEQWESYILKYSNSVYVK